MTKKLETSEVSFVVLCLLVCLFDFKKINRFSDEEKAPEQVSQVFVVVQDLSGLLFFCFLVFTEFCKLIESFSKVHRYASKSFVETKIDV